MQKRFFCAAIALFFILSSVSAAKKDVKLNLNFANKTDWKYSIGYHSQCIYSSAKSNRAKARKTDINCDLVGKVSDKKDSLELSLTDMNIQSTFYSDSEKTRITRKLSATKYNLLLINGYPTIDADIDLTESGMPEWNFYMQFARLLPEMPSQAVHKGFTWERQAVLPVKTNNGKMDCEVYRQFKIARFSPKKDTVYITWQYRYAATNTALDTSTILRYVPVAGSGSGEAVVDITKGNLIRATTEFTTPVVSMEGAKINWVEKMTFELK
jgi:hypothetical protein